MSAFWIDFVFGALQTILTASIKNPTSDKAKLVGAWLDRIENLILALKAKLTPVPTPGA